MPPAKRKWYPGARPARDVSEEKFAWALNYIGEHIIFVQDPAKLFTEEGYALSSYNEEFGPGDNVHLYLKPTKARGSITLMLTNLTVQELDELKELYDTAFEWARPVCEIRDRDAREKLESGDDDVNPRNYRQVPRLVFRKRPQPEHGEGLQVGPEGVSYLGEDPAADNRDSSHESGTSGDAVAESLSPHLSPEDDTEAYYESEELGAVGEGSADPDRLYSPDSWAARTTSDPRGPEWSGEDEGGSEVGPAGGPDWPVRPSWPPNS